MVYLGAVLLVRRHLARGPVARIPLAHINVGSGPGARGRQEPA
jgi:hypothetical protein